KVDWTALRAQSLARAADAQTTYDTYKAVRFALRSLNDHHSFLQLSNDLARKEKELEARRADPPAAKPAASEKWPPSPFIDRRTPEGALVTINGALIATIVVPLLENGDDARMQVYANALQDQVESLAKADPSGWIIDLR